MVAKHRNGPTGIVPVIFEPGCMRFYDQDDIHGKDREAAAPTPSGNGIENFFNGRKDLDG